MPLINLEELGFVMDEEDLHLLGSYTWRLDHNGYVCRRSSKSINKKQIGYRVLLHRLIMESHGFDICGYQVDHIDRNKVNCKKSNLRIATHAQNNKNVTSRKNNTTGYKGVIYQGNKYSARIGVNGKKIHLGRFLTSKEAANAYNEAALKYHGDFACLNLF